MGSAKIVMTLMIILSVDVILFLGQISSLNIATEYGLESSHFFNENESFIEQFNEGENGNYQIISNSSGILPTPEDSVSSETGNIFTDSAKSITNWLKDSTDGVITGFSYLKSFLGGPIRYLSIINAPSAFIFSLGALWYGLTLLLLILLIFGR